MKLKVIVFILFCLYFLYFPLSIDASSLNVLKVWKTNGQTETYYLSQKPKLTLSNQMAYLQVDNLVFEYPLSSYLKMTFEDSENLTAIHEKLPPITRIMYGFYIFLMIFLNHTVIVNVN